MQYKSLVYLALASCASAQSITSLLTATPELSNLTTFITLFPDLVAQLSNATNITILAPSNDAFADLLEGPVGAQISTNDTDLIKAVLTYHVLQGVYPAASVSDTPAFIPTLLNNPKYSNVTGGQVVEAITEGSDVVFVSGLLTESTVTTADVKFTGGIVHIIDTVLIPPQLVSVTAAAANLTSVVGALIEADLVETVDTTKDITVFAPSNEAFQAIGSALPNLTVEDLTSILTYHVVAGTVGYSTKLTSGQQIKTVNGGSVTITIVDGEIFVNSAKVVVADVLVANGVVHVIDNVLNPANSTATPVPSQSTQAPAFAGASSASEAPYTSGVATATSGGSRPTGTSSAGSATSSPPQSTGAASSIRSGAIGAAALFGAGAALMNL